MTITGKQPMQATSDKDKATVANDGASGREGAGESGGGAYKDKEQVRGDPNNTGFMAHGGQSNIEYSGPIDDNGKPANPNSPTR